jgi:uncharacterized membrane protein YkoI
MNRTRTALTATVLAAATTAGGVALAAGPASAAGDDGLTHAQAAKARSVALKRVPGRAVSIERDREDGGAVSYDVTVLTRAGAARQVHLDARLRVLRTEAEDADGLSYAAAGRASSAALKRVPGIVTGVDGEDDGGARYEVEVLTSGSTERVVRLSSSFRVLSVATDAETDGRDDD